MTPRVPYIPDETIERDAEALLGQYAHARGIEIKAPIPIEDIVEKHLKLPFEFDDLHRLFNVPRSGLAPDIFGAFWLDSDRIVIDESLDPEEHPEMEGRYRYTLAHEGGGHGRLHRALLRSVGVQEVLFADVPKPTIICRSSQAKERVEWQADFYASCLLMPRSLIMQACQDRLGKADPLFIWRLAEQFLVSPIAMRIRLEKLGLLHRQVPRQQLLRAQR